MKKVYALFIIVLVLLLSSCITITETSLSIKLNPGVDTIEVGETFNDAGASANYGFRKLNPIIISDNVNHMQIGVYEITYQIQYLDFEKSITRYVTVVDNTPPVLSLNPGIDTVVLGKTWIDASVSLIENSLGEVVINVEGSVDVNTAGEYVISYHATDINGNTSHISRYVTVVQLSA